VTRKSKLDTVEGLTDFIFGEFRGFMLGLSWAAGDVKELRLPLDEDERTRLVDEIGAGIAEAQRILELIKEGRRATALSVIPWPQVRGPHKGDAHMMGVPFGMQNIESLPVVPLIISTLSRPRKMWKRLIFSIRRFRDQRLYMPLIISTASRALEQE
jgi:hypothetical protein